MKYSSPIVSVLVLGALFMSGCDSSSSSNNGGEEVSSARFIPMSMMNQNIIQDVNTSLEWVNGNQMAGVESGCLPMGPGQVESVIKATASNHCENLMFAGHDDWRVPTIEEVQEFTVSMQAEGLVPFYANPSCPRVVGLDENGTINTINTHNTDPIGMINSWNELNAGVRCVREF